MNKFLLLFIGISILHLGFEYSEQDWVVITKPLLMPSLCLYLLDLNDWETKEISSLIFALVFSTAGDVFLLFSNLKEGYFIAGLGGFLIAHLFYLKYFYKNTKKIKSNWYLIAGLSAYVLGFLFILRNGLAGILNIAVPIYAIILACMGYAAIQFSQQDHIEQKWRISLGAILFICSDSLIGLFAFTDFELNITVERLGIMITYILAQFLLVSGSNLFVEVLPSKKN